MKLRTLFPLVIALTTTGVYAQNDIETQSHLGKHNFDGYDSDKNGSLSREEFDKAIETVTIYENYDADKDGRISNDEYAGIGVEDNMEIWDIDGDGYLDSDEFYDGTFTSFDDNEDGHWDGDEWDDAGDAGLLDV
jgi:hypothetical protein